MVVTWSKSASTSKSHSYNCFSYYPPALLPSLSWSTPTSHLQLPARAESCLSSCITLTVPTGLTESMTKFRYLKLSKYMRAGWIAEWGVWTNIFMLKTIFNHAAFQREKKSPYPSSGIEGCKVLHSLGVKTTSKSSSGKSPSSCASSESKLFSCIIRKPSKSSGSTAS